MKYYGYISKGKNLPDTGISGIIILTFLGVA
jgi:hypothetical protein